MSASRDCGFDEEQVLQWLREAWSAESSTLWKEASPARGQCGVTALVVQDRFGGEILKTPTQNGMHFYNHIDGERHDLTAEQFDERPNYLDLPSDREEAFADTNGKQYAALSERFCAAVDERLTVTGSDRLARSPPIQLDDPTIHSSVIRVRDEHT